MINGTMIQYFEWALPKGMLWKKLTDEAGRLSEDGFTAVWIPPAYKGAWGEDDIGYSPYDLYDLGEFDQRGGVPTRYGTKEELAAAIRAVQSRNMQVYADIVFDHMMGADATETVEAREVNPENRYENEGGYREIAAWTNFKFPGRNRKYSDFEWHWNNFTGIDQDANTGKKGIYRFRGKNWQKDVDKENGNFDYLMGANIDLNDVEVQNELVRWGKWFLDQTGVDGFRMDAVKHMETVFLDEWLEKMREYTGRELFTVGEYWHGDYGALKYYVDQTSGAMSLFDAPLHFRFQDAANYGENFDLRGIFAKTLTKDNPMKSVTFVDNHDTQPGQSLSSWVDDWFKPIAYALILLRKEGYPCVFYGDYYGIEKDGIAPKRDMLLPLLRTRSKYAYGAQNDYFDQPGLVGWTREGDEVHENSGVAVVISNDKPGRKKMYLNKKYVGAWFYDITGNTRNTVRIAEDGTGRFPVEERSVSVYVRVGNK
ncbi:MAG: alpha-amylase [Christensenellaceae bacterium]|jgi:alpha-amylase